MFIPDPDFLPIPDPDPEVKNNGSRIRIRDIIPCIMQTFTPSMVVPLHTIVGTGP